MPNRQVIEAEQTMQGPKRPPRVLLADDQQDVTEALRLLLKGAGYQSEIVGSIAGILAALETATFDALLMDLNYGRDTTSGREGLDVLPRVRAIDETLPIIVMTAWGSIESAVEAIRRGAWDYLEKPWDNARLLDTLSAHCELGEAIRSGRRTRHQGRVSGRSQLPTLIAESPRMAPVLKLMERVGPSEASVIVTGEHGTGKEVVARWLHAVSARAKGPFVAVNMAGLSDGVFESELFGHVKGSFTDAKNDRAGRLELANGGTLFLDEITNVPLNLQAKLLRVLQTLEVERVGTSKAITLNARVISATNVDPREEVAAGRFREDLLFRLNTIEIRLPPLRERREDIPLLAAHFLEYHATRYNKPLESFEPAAMQALRQHNWPGNIRELDHAVERAALLAQDIVVRSADLELYPSAMGGNQRFEELTLAGTERMVIQKALSRSEGNVNQAAKMLGLSRSALYRRMAAYGL